MTTSVLANQSPPNASAKCVSKRVAKFKGQYTVEYRVDSGADVVEYSRYVGQVAESNDVGIRRRCDVNGHQSLCMEWGPANEKCNHHSNCKEKIQTD